ncbi:uncharacterized protein WM277_016625 isoform 1-T1 [Molossus nigricans]
MGVGSRGAPRLRRGGPSSAPAPSGTDAQRQEGSRAGASLAHRPTRLSLPRSGLARAGCRGFCSQGPSPSPGEAEGSSERPGHPGWRKVRGGSGYPTPPVSRTYTKGKHRNVQSLPAKVVRDPNRGRLQEAAASSREKEGRGDRAGSERRGCEGKNVMPTPFCG